MKLSVCLLAFGVLAFGATAGFIGCDDDCPTCPTADLGPSHNLYISGTNADEVYVYNTRRQIIFDSIPMGHSLHIGAIAVSGDGRHLLVAAAPESNPSGASLTVIDAKTGDTVLVYNDLITNVTEARIEVSNTGRYMAVYDGANVHFLDGATFAVLFSDTLDVYCGRFTFDDARFYCVWRQTDFVVYDMAAESLTARYTYVDWYKQSPSLYGIQPLPGETKFYLLAAYESAIPYINNDNVLTTYQFGQTGLIFGQGIWRPLGDLRISPDSSVIIASDPGDVAAGHRGSGFLVAYDRDYDGDPSGTFYRPAHDQGYALAGKACVSPGYFPTDSGLWYMIAGDFAFTPDSRYAVVADERGQGFALLDVPTLRYVDVEYRPITGGLFNLVACQKNRETFGQRVRPDWPQRGEE